VGHACSAAKEERMYVGLGKKTILKSNTGNKRWNKGRSGGEEQVLRLRACLWLCWGWQRNRSLSRRKKRSRKPAQNRIDKERRVLWFCADDNPRERNLTLPKGRVKNGQFSKVTY